MEKEEGEDGLYSIKLAPFIPFPGPSAARILEQDGISHHLSIRAGHLRDPA